MVGGFCQDRKSAEIVILSNDFNMFSQFLLFCRSRDRLTEPRQYNKLSSLTDDEETIRYSVHSGCHSPDRGCAVSVVAHPRYPALVD